MDELDFLLGTMIWSFSRLNSFYNCKYEWLLHYIECNPSENGAFGEYGSLMHEILEKYAKGELSLFELNQYYEENFDEKIPHDFPPNKYVDLRQSYFDKGLDYLDSIDLDFDKYEILGVEKKVEFQIDGRDMVGFIDLLVRDKETDEIIIIDHKSASIKILKNGNISKSDQEHFLEFRRQLALYALAVREEYGKVDKLMWNMFKDRRWIEIPWTQEIEDDAVQWAKDTLALIENEKGWCPNPQYYYCNFLYGQRDNCEHRDFGNSNREYNPEME